MPQPNRPPVFSSAATASAAENSAGTIYTAAASDPDNNSLTYSIAGGADQAQFRITSAGALTFATPPDFEAPADADRNNVYLVTIGVSDGTTSATLDLAATVTNAGPDAFRVARVGTGFAGALFVAPVPDNSGRVFVAQQSGRISLLNPASGASTPFLDLAGTVEVGGEGGLLGLATAPDYATSGVFYVYVTNTSGDIEIRRYRTLAANRDQGDPGSADVIAAIPHPVNANHNGGWIGFGPDGFLYAATGDGGAGGDPPDNAQNLNILLGKILRLDVSRDDFANDTSRDYGIPAGNPFAASGGRPEIWAYGLRNPFRNSFDGSTLIIADVGQAVIEEINLQRAGDAGANFGWAQREGTQQFKGPNQSSFVPPVTEYDHGNGPRQGFSVTGGYVYRGPVEALRGQYFFGDFVTGNLWTLPFADFSVGTTLPSSRFTLRTAELVPNAGSIDSLSSFGLDQAGNLYIVDYDGEIFRIEAT